MPEGNDDDVNVSFGGGHGISKMMIFFSIVGCCHDNDGRGKERIRFNQNMIEVFKTAGTIPSSAKYWS